MSNFTVAAGLIIAIETEKLTNHAWDNGGLTKFGISQNAFPNVDVPNLTFGAALELYRTEFWEKNRCDDLPWMFALPLFDGAVLQGSRGAKALQKALGIVADGVVGSRTVRAANAVAPRDRPAVLANFLSYRAKKLSEHEDWKIAGRGWLRRLFLIQIEALKET